MEGRPPAKARLLAAVLCAALLLAAAAAAVLCRLAPPRKEGFGQESVSAAYEGHYNAVVFGEDVKDEGKPVRVPYGTTYGELFARLGVQGAEGYDLAAPLRFEDAVLAGGEYYLYIVV